MRSRSLMTAAALVFGLMYVGGTAQTRQHLNPMIDLLAQKKPLFGVYWPGNPQGRRGGPPPADAVMKPPSDWAKDALAYKNADFLFNGSMEGGVDRAIGGVTDFIKAASDAGALTRTPFPHFAHPFSSRRRRSHPTRRGRRRRQPRAEPRRQRHHVRRDGERGGSESRHRGDALQVEGRHAPGRSRRRAEDLGHERRRIQTQSRSLAAQSRRRARQLDHRRKQGRPRARPRDRAGERHRRAVAGAAPCAASSRRPTTKASASSIKPAGRTRSKPCSRRARNFTCRVDSRRRRPTSRCA